MIERTDVSQVYDVTPGVHDYPFAFGAMDAASIFAYDLDPEIAPTEPGYRTRIVDAVVVPAPLGIRAGGSVHIPTLPPEGHQIEIRRSTEVTQSNAFEDQNRVIPKTIENSLDKLVMIDQEQGAAIQKGGETVGKLQDGLATEIQAREQGDAALGGRVDQAQQAASAAATLAQQAREAAQAAATAAQTAEAYAQAAQEAADVAVADAKDAVRVATAAETAALGKVSKSGDTMTGPLVVRHSSDNTGAIYLGLGLTGVVGGANGGVQLNSDYLGSTAGIALHTDFRGDGFVVNGLDKTTGGWVQMLWVNDTDILYKGISLTRSYLPLTGGTLNGPLRIGRQGDQDRSYDFHFADASGFSSSIVKLPGDFRVQGAPNERLSFWLGNAGPVNRRGYIDVTDFYMLDSNGANPLPVRSTLASLPTTYLPLTGGTLSGDLIVGGAVRIMSPQDYSAFTLGTAGAQVAASSNYLDIKAPLRVNANNPLYLDTSEAASLIYRVTPDNEITWKERMRVDSVGLRIQREDGFGVLVLGTNTARIFANPAGNLTLDGAVTEQGSWISMNTGAGGHLRYQTVSSGVSTELLRVNETSIYYRGTDILAELAALRSRVAALDGGTTRSLAPSQEFLSAQKESLSTLDEIPVATVVPQEYILNSTGTYHLPTCSFAGENGESLTLDAILEARPDAKPCSRCNPPVLSREVTA